MCLFKAKNFNQVVMMDLKEVTKWGVWVLHTVDCTTRYTAATVIKSKKKEVIVNANSIVTVEESLTTTY